jgi:hypothetical protein
MATDEEAMIPANRKKQLCLVEMQFARLCFLI